jgi:hypothetical protein
MAVNEGQVRGPFDHVGEGEGEGEGGFEVRVQGSNGTYFFFLSSFIRVFFTGWVGW